MKWLWTAAALIGLALGVGVTWFVHDHPKWGQPIESAGGAAAAIFAATAGIASAVAADRSRKTARDAARSLLLHERPDVQPGLTSDVDGPAPRFELGRGERGLRDVVQVDLRWKIDGHEHTRRLSVGEPDDGDNIDRSCELNELEFVVVENAHLIKGDEVTIKVTDDRGTRWTAHALKRGDYLGNRFSTLMPIE